MVSVIVCTYNREKYIGTCLEHLASQTANPKDYEVLIIDNKSTDNTANIAKKFIEENPSVQAQYLLEENQGHTYARNRGIKEANGKYLSFIDDDAFVEQNFIKGIMEYFSNHIHVQALGGKIIPEYETGRPKWMSKFLLPLVSALDMGSSPKRFKGSKFPIGANMSFRKEVFEKYGLFDVELGRRGSELEGGDEKEVFIRLKRNNEEIHYVPTVVVKHIIPEKRIKIDYIKGLALGVGTSERKRLKKSSFSETAKKIWSESIKFAGTIVLFFAYTLQLRFQASFMLLRFRLWVLKGLLF